MGAPVFVFVLVPFLGHKFRSSESGVLSTGLPNPSGVLEPLPARSSSNHQVIGDSADTFCSDQSIKRGSC